MFDLVISIVTYNSNLNLLRNLVQQINDEKRIKIKLIIADNLSTKEYIFYIKKFLNFPHQNFSGAFMFFRRGIYKKINGFDKRFFMYFEDVDICKRIIKYGKIGVLNYSFAFHERSRDSYKSLRMMLIHLISFIKYQIKIYKN